LIDGVDKVLDQLRAVFAEHVDLSAVPRAGHINAGGARFIVDEVRVCLPVGQTATTVLTGQCSWDPDGFEVALRPD